MAVIDTGERIAEQLESLQKLYFGVNPPGSAPIKTQLSPIIEH